MSSLNRPVISVGTQAWYTSIYEHNLLEVHPAGPQHRCRYGYVCHLLSRTRRTVHAVGWTPDDHGGVYGALRYVRAWGRPVNKNTKKKLYNWWINADFRWATSFVLVISAVVLAILDAIDLYTSAYRTWAVGCVAAMLLYAIHAGPRP